MALKKLGQQADPVADALLYGPAAGFQAAVVVEMCNTGAVDRTVRISHTTGAATAASTAVVWDLIIPAGEAYTRGYSIGPGASLYVKCSGAGITFTAHGDETTV